MSKHSIRIGSDSRLSASRSSSSPSSRRRRFASLTAVSEASATRAFSAASSESRRFSPRSGTRTSTREPRRSERNSASAEVSPTPGGTTSCGGTRGSRPVVLDAERLQDRRQVLSGDVLEVEAVPVDHLAPAERKDLDGGAVAVGGDADHVDRADGGLVRRLALGQVAHREEPVPVAGRVLEALLGGGRGHPALQLAQDRPRLAREELDDAVDDPAVVLLRDVAHAGRRAALDVVVEARDARVPAGLRPLARPELEDAVEHVERLAHLLRVRVRAEVPDAAAVPLAGEHHARVVVLHGDRDVRERLVVAQPDVERWPVPLDEILLEVQRLDLGAGDDHLDAADPLAQLRGAGADVARLLEVRAHARAQGLRLADVQHLVTVAVEEVDAGLRGQPPELLPDAVGHRG